MTYYRTFVGDIVISDGNPDRDGYVAAAYVMTGRSCGRLRLSALRLATALEIQKAEAECLELANSPEPPHDCELARARIAARKRLEIAS